MLEIYVCKTKYGKPMNNPVESIKHIKLFPAWKPKAGYRRILNRTKIIIKSGKIPKIIANKNSKANFVIVIYKHSNP